MPNSYFRFKQFKVDQGACAMKVSTEACIFGAWIPVEDHCKTILDIGAGTGLLSLMLAQRTNLRIDAVEIDPEAAGQCQENFESSPWADRLKLYTTSVFDFANQDVPRYDLIICNPPFYTASLKSNTVSKNLAKHDTGEFNKTDFAKSIDQLLTNTGTAYILYPKPEADEFTILAKTLGLFVKEVLIIKNQPTKTTFRIVLKVSRQVVHGDTEELCIRSGQNHTTEFEQLLKSYYLRL